MMSQGGRNHLEERATKPSRNEEPLATERRGERVSSRRGRRGTRRADPLLGLGLELPGRGGCMTSSCGVGSLLFGSIPDTTAIWDCHIIYAEQARGG